MILINFQLLSINMIAKTLSFYGLKENSNPLIALSSSNQRYYISIYSLRIM